MSGSEVNILKELSPNIAVISDSRLQSSSLTSASDSVKNDVMKGFTKLLEDSNWQTDTEGGRRHASCRLMTWHLGPVRFNVTETL